MSLTRKTRLSGRSIVVTLPSQIAEAFDIREGDMLEIFPQGQGTIVMKKVESLQSQVHSS